MAKGGQNKRLLKGQKYTPVDNSRTDAGGTFNFVHDSDGRMLQAYTNPLDPVEYKYDALGRRVSAKEPGQTAITYTFDGDDVMLSNSVAGLSKFINGPGIDNKVSARIAGTSGRTFYLGDHLGTTYGTANDSNVFTPASRPDSFGNLSTDFTGREYDTFTGLYYYRARMYDPKLGRFTSEDPIGFAGGDVNLYGYVWNNPLRFRDPMGLDARYDEQLWRAQQDLIDSLAGPIEFGIGFGDTTLFGLSRSLRQWQGIDDPNLDCSSWYEAGGWTAVAVQIAAGGVGGLRAAGGKAAGFEFSHWIPKRLGGPRSFFNGNYVTIAEHALTDPFRFRFMPRIWKASNPMFHPVMQQWYRIPRVFKGLAIGIAAGGASGYATSSACECK